MRIILPKVFTPDHTVSMMFAAVKPETHRAAVIPQQPFYAPRFADPQYDRYKALLRIGVT